MRQNKGGATLFKTRLFIPGPTPINPEVQKALSSPMINHRGPEYEALQKEIVENLKKVFKTSNPIIVFPSAGTGGMEAAIVNFLSPGDKVICASIGVFGDRFASIAKAYGAEVVKVDFEWGKAIDPSKLQQALDDNPDAKALLMTHNETSTGVTNDLWAIKEILKEREILWIVDAISSLVAIDLPTDELGVDVVVGGSQKAFMIPPGLSFLAVSEKALKYAENAQMPRFYFDIKAMLKSMERNQTPYTPALPQLFALREALRQILEEGLDNVQKRHKQVGETIRRGIKAIGLKIFADEKFASNTVTAIYNPEGVDVRKLRSFLREKFGVVLAGGQGAIQNTVFRIGHLGYVDVIDALTVLSALEIGLKVLGYPVELGKGVKAGEEFIAEEVQ
ncbi:alanine--glyoxylate aminotransferase family protein [bacterium]|nr:alanine--glyoxylate aminotransferase family protein [bacterium]